MRRWAKGIGIGVAALVLSTLGISASDTLQGVSGSLVSLALQSGKTTGCPANTVLLVAEGREMCVDVYEASVGDTCPHKDPKNLQDTEKNLALASCSPVSKKDAVPWRFVNLSQAQRACAAAGKRLLGSEEWYRSALGTPTDQKSCYLGKNEAVQLAGVAIACVSSVGAYDMIGNVWEWVDAQVTNGMYQDRALPQGGYVTGVDADGVPVSTGEQGDELYGEDYLWEDEEGVRGVLRGGFYGSGSDGGVYAVNASMDLGFGSAGIGFRCVTDFK